MTFLGLKLHRYKQWRDALSEEGRTIGWPSLIWLILRSIWLPVSRQEWRSRMRKCGRCIVYNGETKQCRPHPGSPLGCGCFQPIAAKFKKSGEGWGTQNLPPGEVDCW
jgi:hypothetical protein